MGLQLQDARNYLLLSIHAVDSYLAATAFTKDGVQTVADSRACA